MYTFTKIYIHFLVLTCYNFYFKIQIVVTFVYLAYVILEPLVHFMVSIKRKNKV